MSYRIKCTECETEGTFEEFIEEGREMDLVDLLDQTLESLRSMRSKLQCPECESKEIEFLD